MQLEPKPNNLVVSETLEPIQLRRAPDIPSAHLYQLLEENPLLHYRRILIKRKWWILATLIVVFALSVIKTLTTIPLYQATSKIAIYPENPNVLGFKDGGEMASLDYQDDVGLETQAAILRSDVLAMNVIGTMHLDRDSRFVGAGQASTPTSNTIPISSMNPDPFRIAGLLGRFHGGLNVQIIPGTRLMQISYTDPNPQLAAEIANGLVKTFVEQNFKTKYESVTQTSEWLSKELADLQMQVETSEEKLVRYQKDHSILGIDEKQNIVTAKLDALNRELTATQSDRIQKESNYKFASSDPSLFAKVSPERSNMLARLRDKEGDLNTQYSQLTTQFGTGYPKVSELTNQLKEVRSQIAAEEKRVREGLLNEYLGAVQREKLLTDAFEAQKREANKLNESAIEYSVLKRDADSNRQLYDNLLQRLKEAGVSAGLRSSNIRVVDVARTPTGPISPNIPRNLMLGFLMGLAGGLGLAFVLESLDSTVRTMEDVSAISPLPALATIPLYISSKASSRKWLPSISGGEKAQIPTLITCVRPKSEAAEAYRALRTSILLSSFGAPPKVILVTSASPQEGKTTVSANSALVLAQRGSRVLLVDADLRRPGVAKLLGLGHSGGGLSSLISGVDKFEDIAVPFAELPNLTILPAGPIPPQPAELLSSAVMRDHLAGWRNEFDHIIIDSPPCLSVTDAVVLSPEVDRVILVARSAQTTKIALRRACEILLQVNAKVMGVVLNALNVHSADGYSYYYYGGHYAGRSYYIEDSSSNDDAITASTKVS